MRPAPSLSDHAVLWVVSLVHRAADALYRMAPPLSVVVDYDTLPGLAARAALP